MVLSEVQKKFLRGMGHRLKPIITIGAAGLTDSVRREFDASISHHELVKVRVRAPDREVRNEILAELCDKTSAEMVTRIGNVALLYRNNPDKTKIPLPL